MERWHLRCLGESGQAASVHLTCLGWPKGSADSCVEQVRNRPSKVIKRSLRARVSNWIRKQCRSGSFRLNAEEELAYRDLREFVRKLEKEGELTRIRTEVDPNLGITEVTQGARRAKGASSFFDNPAGS